MATLDLSPGVLNLVVQQGSLAHAPMVLTDKVTGDPLNLTGYLARMMVRSTARDSTVVLSLSTATTGLVWVNAAVGALNLHILATALTAVAADFYVHDLELVPSDGVGGHDETLARAYAAGTFRVKAQVTR